LAGVHDLLFELSNEDRFRILSRLKIKPLKLTQLSTDLDLPVQEISRQLSRLDKMDLVQKDTRGNYSITSYGENILDFVPSLTFLHKNKKYFKTHTLSKIPHKFLTRIGELSSASYVGDVMQNFHNSEEMIKRAEKYVWIISDQILMSTLPFTEAAIDRGCEHRFIGPQTLVPPEGFYEEAQKRRLIGPHGRAKSRFLNDLGVSLAMSEKEVAYIIFPADNGKFDYTGFRDNSAEGHAFCEELFFHYWEKSNVTRSDEYRKYLENLSLGKEEKLE
jgi:predicted transcriptional regulator